jgi:hypothetical protein
MRYREDSFQELDWQAQVIDRTIWDGEVVQNESIYFVVLLFISYQIFSLAFELSNDLIRFTFILPLTTLTFIIHFANPLDFIILLIFLHLKLTLYFGLIVFLNVCIQLISGFHVIKD